MSFAFRSAIAAAIFAAATACGARELRVCADPDNFPLSRSDGAGFENRIAELLAAELGAELRYAWWPDRGHGFVRKTLGADVCDVLIGVPKAFERVLTTRPYYRSAYVFVEGPHAAGITSLDDARLHQLRIGVQLIGNDLAATPPGHALARAGCVENVRGFTAFGEGPAAARIVSAIGSGALDLGLVWGPQAAYLATQATPALEIHRASAPPALAAFLPFEFDIAVGVRRGDNALRDELDAAIARRQRDIDAILDAYAVPRTSVARGDAQ